MRIALLSCAAALALPCRAAPTSAPESMPHRPAMRALPELMTTDDPAWPFIQGWIAAAPEVQALSVYPFLWAEGPAIDKRSRKAVPVDDLYRL